MLDLCISTWTTPQVKAASNICSVEQEWKNQLYYLNNDCRLGILATTIITAMSQVQHLKELCWNNSMWLLYKFLTLV